MSEGSTSKRWNLSSGLTFWGVTVQTVFSLIGLFFILYVVYNMIDIALSGLLPSIASMSLDYYEDRMMVFIVVVAVCVMISFLGYLVYLVGICLFKGAQRSIDSEVRTRNIMIVELLLPILAILSFVILINYYQTIFNNFTTIICYYLLPLIVMLVAVIIFLIQYGALSKEDTWSEKARGGAGDVKTSYACLLWMLVVLIIGLGMVALTIFSTYSKLDALRYSGDGYGGMFDGINSLSKMVNDLMNTVKAEILITELFIFLLYAWSTIKRIVGWRMIQLGGNEEVYQFIVKQGRSAVGSFCHKCGTALPNGSAFCPGCGAPVASVAVVVEETQEPAVSVTPEETPQLEVYEDEEADRKKKWILWGGIAAGVIVLAVAIWAIWGRSDKFEPNSKIYADRSVVFKSVEDGVGIEALDELVFGTAIESLASGQDVNSIWTKVAYEANGKIVNGYMAKDDLLYTEDFEAIYKAGLSDGQARFHLPGKGQRLAVLDAVKGNGAEWHLEGIKLYGEAQPNAKRLYVRGADPSELCLGFVMRNSSTGERKFFLYSTPDPYSTDITSSPVFLYSETPAKGEDIVYDASYRKKGNHYEVIYQTNSDSDESEDFLYEGSAIDEAEVLETETVLEGQAEMTGYVDGKYPVKIEVTLHEDGTVSGTVTYLKYNVPMKLTGTYTIGDGYCDLSLDELSEGKVSGNFIGKYDGNSFSGSWVSADGEKEMPFRVER